MAFETEMAEIEALRAQAAQIKQGILAEKSKLEDVRKQIVDKKTALKAKKVAAAPAAPATDGAAKA